MSEPLGRIEFGGPDLPQRRLRDLLQAHVDAAPAGSRIDWATYYFRDRALAEALMRASDRGVQVQLVMESNPRRAGANEAVIAMLSAHGLGGGLHFYSAKKHGRPKGRLHAKIYAFSHPDIAWVGSFNPSGDEPEDPEVIAEIGDQDRGHNLLLGIERPRLTAALRRQIGYLIDPSRVPNALRLMSWWRVRDGDTKLFFYPRPIGLIAEMAVARLGRSGRLRGAISHLKKGPLTFAIRLAVGRGAIVELLVHDTERRVPSGLVSEMRASGVHVHRVTHPDDLPMHAKFLLIERGKQCTAWLGSHNFNRKSLLHNAELLIATKNGQVIDALSERFRAISDMALD
jgi:hypothetical protein